MRDPRVQLRRAVAIAAAGTACTILAGGCTLAPRYDRPAPEIERQWPTGPAYQGPSSAGDSAEAVASDRGWRDFFIDPQLQRLIETALLHNPDARTAALNIAAAQAQYRIQRADIFPSIAATGSETVEKFPAAIAGIASLGGGTAGGGGSTATSGGTGAASGGTATTGSAASAVDTTGSTFRFFTAGIGFTSYELDVFGRIRSLVRQRHEAYLGYIETRRSTQISLIAEVAIAYLTCLGDRELLAVTRDTLASEENSYRLTKMSYEGGVSTELDLRQAETSVDTARANIALYTRQVAQDDNALVVLLGASLPTDLPGPNRFDEERFFAALPAGLPSEVLLRRPDILAAEHNLIGANANIGAARAAFFPSVSLTGNYGTESTKLSGLFEHGSTTWTFSPQISLPIFAGGANLASLDLAKVQKQEAIVSYQQSIQTAFREVSDALAGRGTYDEQIQATQALVDATQASYSLSEKLFRDGINDFLSVLDAQRSLYSARQSLINIKLARMQNLVTLYKALGGGGYEYSQQRSAH